MKTKTERRYLEAADLELRAESDDAPARITGYAAVFNELSDDLGGFREKIVPGAFSKTLGADIRALYNHDPNIVLGRTRSRTLTISEDNKGLRVEFTPPDSAMARSVLESVRRGDVDQMSFGFVTLADTWEDHDGKVVRTLNEVELFDVSVVTYPAYPQTDAAVRSLEHWREETAPAPPDHSIRRKALELIAI